MFAPDTDVATDVAVGRESGDRLPLLLHLNLEEQDGVWEERRGEGSEKVREKKIYFLL